jgi:hypothetical protein
MIRRVFLLGLALALAGCSRNSLPGVYETQGDTTKFKMTLTLLENGTAKLATHAKLGSEDLDRNVAATMTIPAGKWETRQRTLAVHGNRGDGKPMAMGFAIQPNGDLIWTENGARFTRSTGISVR